VRIPEVPDLEPFSSALERHGLDLRRGETTTLQVNVGLICNQACRHCHLEAGPLRPQAMDRQTAAEVVALARRIGFRAIDVTGGAPELVPGIEDLLRDLAAATPRLMVRTNLTALAGRQELIRLFRGLGAAVVASFPSTNPGQMKAQRGEGVWDTSLAMLLRLNEAGYGREGSGLDLDLVSNPAGAFLPPPQAEAEARFRRDLLRRWGITFNRLYTFANVPLGRFRAWLRETGNLDSYLEKLATTFNPCAVEGLMCRTLVSVAWDGTLYDCDFNLGVGLGIGRRRMHVSELRTLPLPGSPIATGDHCYACTSGAGFT